MILEVRKYEYDTFLIAYIDHQIGLTNLASLRERMEQATDLVARKNKKVGVIFIDLDSFQAVYDTIDMIAEMYYFGRSARR